VGFHFLTAERENSDRSLFISLGDSKSNVKENAAFLGFDLSRVAFLDLSPSAEYFSEVEAYDIFNPAEVEREPTTRRILHKVDGRKPDRVFIDSITQFRYLSPEPYQYRRQIFSLLRFLAEQGATVLFSSEAGPESPDEDLQFLSQGVISLSFTPAGRSLEVIKYHGSDYRTGKHFVRLTSQGMEVFPRLLPEMHKKEFVAKAIPSGLDELDALFHGGLERGTITVISGPSGVGKTTVGMLFMQEAAKRGERSVVYAFDEEIPLIEHRCEALKIPARRMIEEGNLSLAKVEPLQHSPDEFDDVVRREVEEKKAKIIMLDSIAGYRLSIRGEDLLQRLHALGKYMSNMGVTVIMVDELKSLTGELRPSDAGISYMADNIVFLRYIEHHSSATGYVELRKVIGVLKKRLSDFEKTFRELYFGLDGITVGEPLPKFSNILSYTAVKPEERE
jgi:circadian clock protein KaiC